MQWEIWTKHLAEKLWLPLTPLSLSEHRYLVILSWLLFPSRGHISARLQLHVWLFSIQVLYRRLCSDCRCMPTRHTLHYIKGWKKNPDVRSPAWRNKCALPLFDDDISNTTLFRSWTSSVFKTGFLVGTKRGQQTTGSSEFHFHHMCFYGFFTSKILKILQQLQV